MSNLYGYIILAVFAVLFIGISVVVSKKFPIEGVDDFVTAGRGIPAALVAASVMVSWVWTTTIMGAAEAGLTFGISGGISYAWGNSVPFFILIPLVLHLRKKMPKCTTFTEFIEQRYNRTVANMFFVFGVGVIIYVLIAQCVGIGTIFSSMFGIPYEIGASVPIIIVAIYISKAGLRGSLFNDVIQFFIISIIMIISVPLILKTLGVESIYNGMVDVVTNPANINHNPDALNPLASGGLMYGFTAIVVASGQVLLDQGYYSKAIATADSKQLLKAYIIGTVVAWMPIPIICGGVFGGSVLSMGVGVGNGLEGTSEAAPYIMSFIYGGGLGAIMFVLMVFMAGMTTGGGCLAGIQALFTTDFYKKFVNKTATEEQTMRFGRIVTFIVAIAVIIISILLKGRSLLMMDIFSGILFAAPTSSLIAGMVTKRTTPKIAIISMILGLAAGLTAFFVIPNDDINWFVGNILALVLPAVIVIVGSLTSKYEFDFDKLAKYEPDHEVK
ncbi:MAG: Na(+)/glucose symporter [Firmicutes bacterium]|nr:Na(+)/glucose symporter [Bacillota bacterium]